MIIKSVTQIEVTVLVDNYTDLLLTSSYEPVHRPSVPYGKALFAEHGLSLYIKITLPTSQHALLMDAGVSEHAIFYNASLIGIDLKTIEAIVISHGHYDHTGSLSKILQLLPESVPVIMHPGACAKRRKKMPDGSTVPMLLPCINEIRSSNDQLNLSENPTTIFDNHLLISGEIERTTIFEHGSPILEVETENGWTRDRFIDDQSVIINLEDKGLVVITGCAHAGIINTIRYAQKITGINKVHAVMGGFHLSGLHGESSTAQTINMLKQIAPDYIIPMHCTGWKDINMLLSEMPNQGILNIVGTRYLFGSSLGLTYPG